MLIFDFYVIGNKLYNIRKKLGLTQAEVAEKAGIADRTYADIERGDVNTRISTILKICKALNITPDEILTEENPNIFKREGNIFERLDDCTPKEKAVAYELLKTFLKSRD